MAPPAVDTRGVARVVAESFTSAASIASTSDFGRWRTAPCAGWGDDSTRAESSALKAWVETRGAERLGDVVLHWTPVEPSASLADPDAR